MINILSYAGLTLHSEVCLWAILGILRTIFDATLFKVNSNLKQVWQMKMPTELSLSVQRLLRTMISGVMLVQCFTLYVYLASYIVLLYPVFLEERPTLVLPWLLLAAVRKLLCELVSLALGLGTCVLLGPATPPCITFVVTKLATILPSAYMWILVYTYYHTLKVASAFKTMAAVLPANKNDFGLELAVRRRRTKSLLGEKQLRRSLMANVYEAESSSKQISSLPNNDSIQSPDASTEDIKVNLGMLSPITTGIVTDLGINEDWYANDIAIPRDTDRILEQFVIMLMKIGEYMKQGFSNDTFQQFHMSDNSNFRFSKCEKVENTSIPSDAIDTPPGVGSSKGTIATYLREYPQIFMKKSSEIMQSPNILDNSTLRLDNANIKQLKKLSRQKTTFLEKDDNRTRKQCNELQNRSNSSITDLKKIHLGMLENEHMKMTDTNEDIDSEIPFDDYNNTNKKISEETVQKSSIESLINRMTIRTALTEINSESDRSEDKSSSR